jgi:uncharacterized BrkB/YihY/UPF0761 family membrane protein
VTTSSGAAGKSRLTLTIRDEDVAVLWIRVILRLFGVLLIVAGLLIAFVAYVFVDSGCTWVRYTSKCEFGPDWLLYFVVYGCPIPVGIMMLVIARRLGRTPRAESDGLADHPG